jgi:L-malate glycosyltransferase
MPSPVAMLAPYAHPAVGGNAVTVARIARGLRARGVEVHTWDVSATPGPDLDRAVLAVAPALIHAFHAYRTGPAAARLANLTGAPLVITMTGTDVHGDLLDPARAGDVRLVLERASAITVFHDSVVRALTAALPALATPITVVAQSASFESAAGEALPSLGPGPRLLFPAGIRPVKRPRLPLAPLDRLVPLYPGLRLLYVGPVLDPEEGEALGAALRARPWAAHLGPVPHHRMPALLAAADVVLNCSVSEGGMANAVLEALALGRAVLASDIEGNRSLVEDGVTGLLFDSPAAFAQKAARLAAEPDVRERLGAAGRARVRADFPPEREIDGYLAVYARSAPALLGPR